MKKGYIYMIENDINDKKYIGSTKKNIISRWGSHINDCYDEKNKIYNIKFYVFMREIGFEHFKIKQIDEMYYNDKFELKILEKHYVIKYDSIKNGYNTRLPYSTKEEKQNYYKNNKEKIKKYYKEYYKNNKEKYNKKSI